MSNVIALPTVTRPRRVLTDAGRINASPPPRLPLARRLPQVFMSTEAPTLPPDVPVPPPRPTERPPLMLPDYEAPPPVVRPRTVNPLPEDGSLPGLRRRIDQTMNRDTSKDNNGRLRSFGSMLLRGLGTWRGQGGVAGLVGHALGAGAMGAAMPNLDERAAQVEEVAQLSDQYGRAYEMERAESALEDDQVQREYRQANTEWLRSRPEIEADKLASADADRQRRALASVFNRIEDFDPTAPENAEIVAQMRAVGLPVVPKRRGQKLQFIQDQKSGEWGVISGDPTTGEATAAAVVGPDGVPVATTSSSMVGAEQQQQNRALRVSEGDKNRALRREIAADRPRRAGGRSSAAAVAGVYDQEAARLETEAQAAAEKYGESSKRTKTAREAATRARLRADVAGARAGTAPTPRQRATTRPNAYAGRRISRANLGEAAKRLGLGSAEEAARFITSQGGSLY